MKLMRNAIFKIMINNVSYKGIALWVVAVGACTALNVQAVPPPSPQAAKQIDIAVGAKDLDFKSKKADSCEEAVEKVNKEPSQANQKRFMELCDSKYVAKAPQNETHEDDAAATGVDTGTTQSIPPASGGALLAPAPLTAAAGTAAIPLPAAVSAAPAARAAAPTTLSGAMLSKETLGTGGFEKNTDFKSFQDMRTLDTKDTNFGRYETVTGKTETQAKTLQGLSGREVAKTSVAYQKVDATARANLVNTFKVAPIKNATIATGIPTASSDPKAPLRQAFMNKMINQHGWSVEKAAAFAGQMEAESKAFDPQKLVYDSKTNSFSHAASKWGETANGDNGTSFGVAQFHKDRATGLFNYVGATSRDKSELVGTLYKQFDYIAEIDEPANLSKTDKAKLDSGSVGFYEKVRIATVKYERPANEAGQHFGRAGGNTRWDAAQVALQEYYKETGQTGNTNFAIGGLTSGATIGRGDITAIGQRLANQAGYGGVYNAVMQGDVGGIVKSLGGGSAGQLLAQAMNGGKGGFSGGDSAGSAAESKGSGSSSGSSGKGKSSGASKGSNGSNESTESAATVVRTDRTVGLEETVETTTFSDGSSVTVVTKNAPSEVASAMATLESRCGVSLSSGADAFMLKLAQCL